MDKTLDGHFFVQGVVAQRDGKPYVQLHNEKGVISQFSIAQATKIALDILRMAARTESDATLFKFLKEKLDAPMEAAAALMQMSREFRSELDAEVVEGSESL